MSEERVFQILRRYTPLNAQVDLSAAGGPEADYMYLLVTEDAAYGRFTAQPEEELRRNGLDPDRLDVGRFADLARQLRERAEGFIRTPREEATISQKETSESRSQNWDHSKSWARNYDGYNLIYDQGHDTSKTSSSEAGTTKTFSGTSVTTPDAILRHELNLLFFPAQPLVTPGLMEKIRREVEEGPQ